MSSDPSGAVEVCVDHYPYLDIWEVARLYHVIPTHYPATGKSSSSQSKESSYNCYCKYIQQLCQKEVVEWACFHDNVYLILLWMECLLRTEVSIATELRYIISLLNKFKLIIIIFLAQPISCSHCSHTPHYQYWIN